MLIYVGSGLYFTSIGVDKAFYQISPVVAIMPSIVLALITSRSANRMNSFLDGVGNRDIIIMCIVFLLAGAFSNVTKAIGSVEATVSLASALVPPRFLLVGIFLTAAFISNAIGSSMGTIATIAPIAATLVTEGVFPAGLAMGTVVGGAMFGDNLSLVSDTTIAAVVSQDAEVKAKFRFNGKISMVAAGLTAILLSCEGSTYSMVFPQYSLQSVILLLPYILLIVLAVSGVNVLLSLSLGIAFAGVIGMIKFDYDLIKLSRDIYTGFTSMEEIMLLSLMVGGLSGLVMDGSQNIAQRFMASMSNWGTKKIAQLTIAKIVTMLDVLLANNTIAIVCSGKIAKEIAQKYKIPPHQSATWLDIFSCVSQGIIPHGAQLLLASSISGISPLEVMPYVYYCYILGAVSISYILCKSS